MPIRKASREISVDYDVEPISQVIPAERQSAKRHYGVHPYFTRRPHNVVRAYITHYSREGDVVLDPFGGSGVTPIEAWLENRVGIQNDINPLANFIASGIVGLAREHETQYLTALEHLRTTCKPQLARLGSLAPSELDTEMRALPLPPNVSLPRSSDVEHYRELFTPFQLCALAILKQRIDSLEVVSVRNAMLLAWSATLPKLTRTFLSAEGRAESRGGSSIFSIYRYKVAAKPVELPPWPTFEERARNVLEAKREIDQTVELRRRTRGWHGEFRVESRDVIALADEYADRVDYIFTDPPYGSHIAYLDLSVLWNVWLGLKVADDARERELIVGGDLKLSEDWYVAKLAASMRACARMLKSGRWMSVVFQHWNFKYFQAILEGAADGGADLRAAISQVGDPIWSMHKKKNKESVLAGELILTFYKGDGIRGAVAKAADFNVADVVRRVLHEHPEPAIYGESLFNKVVVDAWRCGAIETLNVTKDDFIAFMRDAGWSYNAAHHRWERSGATLRKLF